jgi:hypothetical protein
MWMMHLLPESFLILIIHALLVTGLIGMVIGFIGGKLPFVGTYATGGGDVTGAGVWPRGAA